jgi:hypothetical protein
MRRRRKDNSAQKRALVSGCLVYRKPHTYLSVSIQGIRAGKSRSADSSVRKNCEIHRSLQKQNDSSGTTPRGPRTDFSAKIKSSPNATARSQFAQLVWLLPVSIQCAPPYISFEEKGLESIKIGDCCTVTYSSARQSIIYECTNTSFLMDEDQSSKSLYQRRRDKEVATTESEIESRARWSLPILSTNKKCSVSLDLPMSNCQPTKVCSEVCYACQGTQYFKKSVTKSLAIERLITEDYERVARKVIDEAEGRAIRVSGSGELTPDHKSLIDTIESYGGHWWGFTRRVDTHRVLPRLMFSFDVSTPEPVMDYVLQEVPVERRAYLRRPIDPAPPIEVAVTFPVHGSVTPQVEFVPYNASDCPVTRGTVTGCWACKPRPIPKRPRGDASF